MQRSPNKLTIRITWGVKDADPFPSDLSPRPAPQDTDLFVLSRAQESIFLSVPEVF